MKKKCEMREFLSRNDLKKFLLMMKFTVVFLLVFTVQLSASVYSQQTRLKVDFNQATIKEVMAEIERQTGLTFFYSPDVLDTNQTVTLNTRSMLLEDILMLVARQTGLSLEVVRDEIVVKKGVPAEQEIAVQQPRSVTGKVTDFSGAGLPGVTVVLKGSSSGTITGSDGSFSLPNLAPDAVLVFSFVGMKTQEMAVTGKATVNVVLQEETVGIEEIVAIGYGTTKKATITESISKVEGGQLQSSPSVNLSNSLAGRLPGLIAVTRSGEPGNDGAVLRIRGSNTLGDNSPLVVVNGIANRSLEGINSTEIESITVLKDASAAIYGSQAANGVILITTKRGEQGKPEISVTVNQAWTMPTVLPEMTDAATYAEMVNEIQSYRDRPPQYSEEEIQKYREGSDPWLYPNTDWFDETYKPFSTQNNVNFSLIGGSDKLKYYFSAGYKYQDGNYRKSATRYSQAGFRSNIDGQVSKNIKLSIDLSGRQENRNYPTIDGAQIFESTMRAFPTQPAYWPNGLPGPDIERGENPVVMVTSATGYDKDVRYVMESNVKLDVTVPWIKGLSLSGNASFDKNIGNSKLWQTPYYLYGWDRQTYDGTGQPLLTGGLKRYSEPRLTQSMMDGRRTTLNALINYEHSYADKHHVKLLAGVEKVKGKSMNFWAFRRYFISAVAQELFAGGDLEKDNNGSSDASARLNYFGRVNYDYAQKYIAEFVWRFDGSYIFPANARFGFFPGVSLGWRISEEEFWKRNLAVISYFKLRGSWGQTGNDRIEEYQYLSSYGFGNSYIFNNNLEAKTLRELRIPNTSVTWEVANQTNVGFDANLFDEKITFSADYFYNLRTNILWWRNASVPATTGLTLPRENIGKVRNQGFEVEAGYKNRIRDFSYQISVNGAYQRNEIIFWDETPGVPEYQKSTGRPMNAELYYKAIGIFKDQAAVDAYPHWDNARPGDIIFEDVNKDQEINALDQVRNEKTDMPKLTGGMTINLTYRNFYSSILLQGAAGAVTIHYSNSGLFGNFMKDDAEGRWTEDHPTASKPRAWNFSEEYWMEGYGINNTYFLRSTDYLRLKNIELGYNLPGSVNNKLGIKGARIYFSGLNLFTLTKLKDYDPETNTYRGYPPVKVYNLGISVTL